MHACADAKDLARSISLHATDTGSYAQFTHHHSMMLCVCVWCVYVCVLCVYACVRFCVFMFVFICVVLVCIDDIHVPNM